MLFKFKKAQSTLEYALLIGIVTGALLYMQNYIKRGIQGKLQAVGDQMGDQYSPELTYRRDYVESTLDGKIIETTTSGVDGKTVTDNTGTKQEQVSTRELKPLKEEVWTATGGAEEGE